jgi:hypothetical protein
MTLLAIALLAAAPAAAPAPVAPPPPPVVQLPPQLTDPATGDRLADTMEALSHAILDLPVGEIQAAVEGRPPTPADRHRTVRQLDPKLDRNLERRIAEARPRIQASMRAMATALPQVMQSLHQAREAIERAAANMPDPNYPKR